MRSRTTRTIGPGALVLADRAPNATTPSTRGRRLWGPLVEEGARALAPYAPAELELMIDFLHRIRELQEAHTSRVRGLARRAEGKTTSGRGQGRGSATA